MHDNNSRAQRLRNDSMKAVLLDEFGGPEVMRIGEAECPEPGPGQILVRVRATSVNRPDVIQRRGLYPPPPGESSVPGLEVAGTVEALGPGTDGIPRGQRVAALVGGGGYAEYALAHAGHVLEIPDALSFEQAACICETYITAYLNLFELARLADGETVLLHGGGGGVTTAAQQLVAALAPRCRVLVTASARKLERVRALGAELVVDYASEDFAAAVREHTHGHGADVILDHIGARYLTPNLKSLAVGGRLVVIAVLGGREAEIDLARLMVKRHTLIGSVLRPRPVDEKTAIIARFRESVMPLFADGRIAPLVDRVVPLAEIDAAHRAMEAGEHFGKIVISVQ